MTAEDADARLRWPGLSESVRRPMRDTTSPSLAGECLPAASLTLSSSADPPRVCHCPTSEISTLAPPFLARKRMLSMHCGKLLLVTLQLLKLIVSPAGGRRQGSLDLSYHSGFCTFQGRNLSESNNGFLSDSPSVSGGVNVGVWAQVTPGAPPAAATNLQRSLKSICTGCKTTSNCTQNDEYYDYEGAFRGVVEGACDVAFTKFTIPAEYALGGSKARSTWTGFLPNSLPTPVSGSMCADVSSFASCNFGSAPPHAIMCAETYATAEINRFQTVMNAANSNVKFNDLFFSGKNVEGAIFAADATETLAYNGTATALTASTNSARATLARANGSPTEVSDAALTRKSNAFTLVSVIFSAWLVRIAFSS